MSIKVHIHKTHRQYTKGMEAVEVEGDTVNQFPVIEKEVFDKKGNLRNIIEIYINLESAYPDELARPVKDGDEIHITYMLAGG